MDKNNKIAGNIALLSGFISILLIIIPSMGFHQFLGGTKNVVLSKIQSKTLVDEVTKAALWCSLIGIILATIKGIFILVG